MLLEEFDCLKCDYKTAQKQEIELMQQVDELKNKIDLQKK